MTILAADAQVPTHTVKVWCRNFTWSTSTTKDKKTATYKIVWDGNMKDRPWHLNDKWFSIQEADGSFITFEAAEVRWMAVTKIQHDKDSVAPTT